MKVSNNFVGCKNEQKTQKTEQKSFMYQGKLALRVLIPEQQIKGSRHYWAGKD
jgi:hypothetical protein